MKTELNWLDPIEHKPDDGETYLVALDGGWVVQVDRVGGLWYWPDSDMPIHDRVERYAEWPKHPRWEELNRPEEE